MAVTGGDGANTGKSGVQFGIYALVVGLLLSVAAVISFMWFFGATMASDGCHGADADYICTVEGQHWAISLPGIAFVAAAVMALTPMGCVAAFRWRPVWLWVGVPLTIGAYVAAPYIANWGRMQGVW
ncbi:hypothetical protein DE4585_02641 [Mycobacteroides salmoniphilum]|uniref:Transmembrane protein n=1 Tax=Mycobacteroides salmoniphilum TaxID=404941 RepID=A0A4V3HYH0_9MYCO|nr:hypothetical protein [Mycobacteroides salmoniphilum]TDZ82112.1 hypothetical protein DE4585_02641 [Mycobacteroides salmoniphilum]